EGDAFPTIEVASGAVTGTNRVSKRRLEQSNQRNGHRKKTKRDPQTGNAGRDLQVVVSDDDDDNSRVDGPRPLFALAKAALAPLERPDGKVDDALIWSALQVFQAALGDREVQIIDSLDINAGIKNCKTFDPRDIFLMINLPNHWAFAHIGEYRDEVTVYDSLPSPEHQLRVQDLVKNLYDNLFPHIRPDVAFTSPRIQQNGYDCGLFVIVNICYL
ncbi:hypothetical protein JX266_014446, partial [Neoarthrinium moseri]